jgi:hypothetical protein
MCIMKVIEKFQIQHSHHAQVARQPAAGWGPLSDVRQGMLRLAKGQA